MKIWIKRRRKRINTGDLTVYTRGKAVIRAYIGDDLVFCGSMPVAEFSQENCHLSGVIGSEEE